MLDCPREAHDPCDKRVVAAVSPGVDLPLIGLGEQFIEAVRGPLYSAVRHNDAERAETRRRHRDQQGRLALATLREITKSRAHELVAW